MQTQQGTDKTYPIDLKSCLRVVHDFPSPGVAFYDICALLENPPAFSQAVHQMADCLRSQKCGALVALEARGFVFGAALAYLCHLPLILVRKRGKLPGETVSQPYVKEYGPDILELQKGVIAAGEEVVIIDDIVATGGSVEAVCQLLEQVGAHPISCLCLGEIEACRSLRTHSCSIQALLTL